MMFMTSGGIDGRRARLHGRGHSAGYKINFPGLLGPIRAFLSTSRAAAVLAALRPMPFGAGVSQFVSTDRELSGVELHLSLCRLDRCGEGGDVVGPILAAAVDEERGRAGPPLEPAESTSSATRAAPIWRRGSAEPVDVWPEVGGVAHQVNRPQLLLCCSSRSCIGQNAPCLSAASAASALSAALGCTSVSGGCRQTYRRSPMFWRSVRTTGSAAAIGALEVAVLRKGHLRIRWAAYVVMVVLHRHGEVD